MAFYLLQRDKQGAVSLAEALARAVEHVGNCSECRMLTEEPICRFCTSPQRDDAQLCVLETPADLLAIEQASIYRGRYFVLMGHLSPIDGIGPEELGLGLLEQRFKQGLIKEVVLATSVTVEGDATALYLARLLSPAGVVVSRLASGLPVGGDLDYADELTLGRALAGRRQLDG